MITVAIVTPLRFLETIQKVITDHDFDCAFRSYTYDSLTDIDEIYAECKDSCDIILFSGELGYHYMHRHYPDCPIPCFFTVYSIADVLSILLQFHLRHPEVALNRLYLDFLTPQNNYLNIQDYLPPEQLPYFFEEPVYDYAHITQRGNELWQAGKIDCVVSRSINNLQQWEKLGIPYEKLTPLIFILIRACVHYALFEDEFYMKSQIETLKETLELFVMKYNPKARSGTGVCVGNLSSSNPI